MATEFFAVTLGQGVAALSPTVFVAHMQNPCKSSSLVLNPFANSVARLVLLVVVRNSLGSKTTQQLTVSLQFSLFCGVTVPKPLLPHFWRSWLYYLGELALVNLHQELLAKRISPSQIPSRASSQPSQPPKCVRPPSTVKHPSLTLSHSQTVSRSAAYLASFTSLIPQPVRWFLRRHCNSRSPSSQARLARNGQDRSSPSQVATSPTGA